MLVRCKQIGRNGVRAACAAMTLVEVLVSVVVLALVLGGVLDGYVQANRLAEWSSMSLAAQSLAQQGMEQARAAQWNSQQFPTPTNSGPGDELYVTNVVGASWSTNKSGADYAMDVPATGAPFYATNYITITTVQKTPPLRMIRSDCVWSFSRDNVRVGNKTTYKYFTNTVISYRAPDQ
jgi:type II secretory pathway pseudopilin PulG